MTLMTKVLLAGVALSLVGGPARSGETAPPPPPSAAQPAASAADAPAVSIAQGVIEAAAAFEGYLRGGAAVDEAFKDAGGVSAALTAASAYAPAQLEDGVVAYAALLAMQDAAFVAGVTAAAASPAERQALSDRLIAQPAGALDLAGARPAAAAAAALMGRMSDGLLHRGQAVRQAAYTIQHQPWSLAKVAQPEARLSTVKARGSTKASVTPAEVERLIGGVVEHRSAAPAGDAAYQPTPALTRGVALAAVALLGHAGEDKAASLEPLLSDKASADCLRMAKLNLHQCLAVAGPQYEDVFCLGQHALADTGQCMVAAVGAPAPASPVQTLVARATGVVIPIAMTRAPAAPPVAALPPAEVPSEPGPAKPLEVSALAPAP